jgi:hypothetical protein
MTNAGQSSTNVGTGDVSGVPDVSQVPGVSDANASDGPNDPSSCLPSILRPQTSTTVAEGDPIGPSGVTADQSSQPGSKSTQGPSKPTSSVFSRSESAPVHNVPMRVIHRPLPSELDESKVQAFMREMQVSVRLISDHHAAKASQTDRSLTTGWGLVHPDRARQSEGAAAE